MSITSKQLCQVSGCRHKAATSIGTKVGAVTICWYACDPCAKRSRERLGALTNPFEEAQANAEKVQALARARATAR